MFCSKSRMLTAVLAAAGAMGSAAYGQTPAVWDGGNDSWGAAKWNGGQTAVAVFGDNRMSNGAFDVTIGGGSQVTYDSVILGGFRPRSNVGPTKITIKEGALWHHITPQDGDADGNWTVWDADLTLDNGTLRRTFVEGGQAQAGGILMLGSWRSVQNQQINVAVKNGGRIENDGQLWFGADEEHALGLKVSLVIDNGTVDLTGGLKHVVSNNDNFSWADMAFFYGSDQGIGNGQTNSGLPKGEDYEINFQGPGSLIVDGGGIVVYHQDMNGAWDQPAGDEADPNVNAPTRSSYQDLWNAGILKVKGMSGKTYLSDTSPTDFNRFFTVTGTVGSANYTVTRKEATTVTWSGGDANWNSPEWDTAGGATNQLPQAAFGRTNGTEGGHDVVISGAGVDVMYDQESDFRVQYNNGLSSLAVKDGASLTLQSNVTPDGNWTRWIGDLHANGGTLRRTKGGATLNGGAFILAGFGAEPGQEININITNGGRVENDGQLWIGSAGNNNDYGLETTITINNGALDLTGGDSGYLEGIDLLEGALGATGPDALIWYGRDDDGLGVPLGEKHIINFTGPGTMTVDHSGIWIATQQADGAITGEHASYETLWARGILQANGQSGLTGASFSSFFTTSGVFDVDGEGSGVLGSDNYTLTSLLSSGVLGDFDGDSDVDGADFLKWQQGGSPNPGSASDYNAWANNFGSASVAAISGAPEPGSLALIVLGTVAFGVHRRRR